MRFTYRNTRTLWNVIAGVCLLLVASACTDTSKLSMVGRVSLAKESGDIQGLIDIALEESSAPGTMYGANSTASEELRKLVIADEALRAEVERILVAERGSDQTPGKRFAAKSALSIVNVEQIGGLKRRICDQALSILTDNPKGKWPVFKGPTELGVTKIGVHTAVDAVVVVRGKVDFNSMTIGGFQPEVFGLTTAELKVIEDGISTIGVVFNYDNYEGRYDGDCTGKAYRIDSHLYVVDLERSSVLSAASFRGDTPPTFSVQSFNSETCDNWGKPYDYSVFFDVGRL